jgi:hypothetical protein
MPHLRIRFVAVLILSALPAIAYAQTVEVRGRPRAGLFVVSDKGRVSLGALNDSGELDVPERLVESGRSFEVMLESSATAIDIALVERGRDNPVCAPDAPTGVTCTRTGTFVTWGRVDRIIISPAGQVTVEAQEEEDGANWGLGVIVDLDVARAFVTNDDRLCREAGTLIGSPVTFTCEVDSATDAFNAAASVTFLRLVAVKVGYLDMGRLDFGLSGNLAGSDVTITGRVGRTRGPTFSGVLRLDVGWAVVPFVEAGVWRWSTDVAAAVAATGPPPTSVETTRSLNGWNPLVGGGVEVWPTRYLGVHAGIKWVSVEEEISDLNGLLDLDDRFRLVFVGLKIGAR